MAETQQQSKVFLSYSQSDVREARRLAKVLESRGVSVFQDHQDLTASEVWQSKILSEIRNAAAVVVVLSADSVTSNWVRKEAELAQYHQVRVIAIKIESVDIPPEWSDVQVVDLAGWDGNKRDARLKRFLREISKNTERVEHREPDRLSGAEGNDDLRVGPDADELDTEEPDGRSKWAINRLAVLPRYVRQRTEAVAVVVLILSIIVWFFGPLVSFGGEAPLEDIGARILAIAGLLSLWALAAIPTIFVGLAALDVIWRIGPQMEYEFLRSTPWQIASSVLTISALVLASRGISRRFGRTEDPYSRWLLRLSRVASVTATMSIIVVVGYAVIWTSRAALARLAQAPSQQAVSPCTAVAGRGPEMVVVPGSTFLMGSPESEEGRFSDERPQREVSVPAFAIGRCEVTFDDYDDFARATGRGLPDDRGWGREYRPVINVSWEDATAYAAWLSDQTGESYRLPTEAEWEYAARAGTTSRFWWGDEVGEGWANCDGCGSEWDGLQSAPVGSFAANEFAIYDTAGNVYEWVQDCRHDNYEGAPADGSAWLEDAGGDCGLRVLRGGSWDDVPRDVRSAVRSGGTPGVRDFDVGFRLAQDL